MIGAMNETFDAAALPRRLTRSTSDRWFTGVCGGIAEYTGIDATIIRVTVAVLVLMGGTGGLAYVLAWLLIPSADATESRADRIVARVRRG
jgi:phage shock protein PspC (stress-responsive transcriptional regulator)